MTHKQNSPGSRADSDQHVRQPLARRESAIFSKWADGYGVIQHGDTTQARIDALAEKLVNSGKAPSTDFVLEKLIAADRLASAAMWLVVHMTYARTVDPSGRPLDAEDFKPAPEGHTGGSLNMVPAYVGYLVANVLTATTRAWIMGQGHCVAAIEAVNVLVGNLLLEQEKRYSRSSEGLTQLARDFYSYAIGPDGRPSAPIGSHVGAHTAGGISEGGYLGFAELEYVHMPLKGESLVAFLSDGAFEEQRGSDWSPRWWRAEDSGDVIPFMILNGRRIEERSEIAQEGGADWLRSHLALSGFDPVDIDGRDPAAFAWAIIEAEDRLSAIGRKISARQAHYPARLPYAIARTIKGYGFPGAGTNRAHNLPLGGNPRFDVAARDVFNDGAKRLWVPPEEIEGAAAALNIHAQQGRAREADHPLARRDVPTPQLPAPFWHARNAKNGVSPMDAIDEYFIRVVSANPQLRPRVGNPDELSSNHMGKTLAALKHRVNRPETGVAEAVDGAIITALNEEAVIGAALGNKGGINLAVSYEAFAVKMLGALRQEIIFARHQKELGRSLKWIGVPLVVTSHTWENGKNEQSHQDPTISEALLGEMSDVARVLFPFDANTAVEALCRIYAAKGQIGCLVTPKRSVPVISDATQAAQICERGALTVAGSPLASDIQLVAIGAYQLIEALQARARLEQRGYRVCVTAVVEPGRLREPRDDLEAQCTLEDKEVDGLFPRDLPRVVITHTRAEPMTGVLRRTDGGPQRTRILGYRNRGGTLDVAGMLFANGCTWAHIAASASRLVAATPEVVLDQREIAAIEGYGEPDVIMNAPRS
jgi:phosphoketolase